MSWEKQVTVEHLRHSHILEFLDDPCLHIGSLLLGEMHGGTVVDDRQGLSWWSVKRNSSSKRRELQGSCTKLQARWDSAIATGDDVCETKDGLLIVAREIFQEQ